MSYQLTFASGSIEAVIDDNCGMKKFYSIAEALTKEYKIKFLQKEDNSDTIDWRFSYKGRTLILHYNIYNGVSITNTHSKDNNAVSELAGLLEKRFY
jgi:hypothetical protein